MDFLEPGDKDLMVKSWGRNRDFLLGIYFWEISISHCLGFLLSLVCFVAKRCENRNICPFFWYGMICRDQ